MIYNRIKRNYLHSYVIIIGLVGLASISPTYYLDNFLENTKYPIMDILYLLVHMFFLIAGFYAIFKKKEAASRLSLYSTTVTISCFGFNYLISGPLQFIIGIYYRNSIIFATDYRAYGGFSFYFDSQETVLFGIGFNITSILIILIDVFINKKK